MYPQVILDAGTEAVLGGSIKVQERVRIDDSGHEGGYGGRGKSKKRGGTQFALKWAKKWKCDKGI